MQSSKVHYLLKLDDLLFAPYLPEMIPQYHLWMSDEEMLYLTASEPLTLEEEKETQQAWLQDLNKYTFIIMKLNDKEFNIEELTKLNSQDLGTKLLEVAKMVGDINLFFHSYIEANEAEIDVMIGEKSMRGQGIAQRAVRVAMQFCKQVHGRDTFIAKIKSDNNASISLFKKLGYTFVSEVAVFNELNFSFTLEDTKCEYQSIKCL